MVDVTEFVLGIIGVFLGAFAAFEFDKFRERQNEKKQSVRVLELLRRELEVNLQEMIPAIRKNVEESKLEFVPVALDIWEAVSNKIDSIANDNALEAIASAYYRLHTLERVLEWYRIYAAIYFSISSNEKLKPNLRKGLQSIAGIILERIREPKDEQPKDEQERMVIVEIREAISEIDKEIQRLEN